MRLEMTTKIFFTLQILLWKLPHDKIFKGAAKTIEICISLLQRKKPVFQIC